MLPAEEAWDMCGPIEHSPIDLSSSSLVKSSRQNFHMSLGILVCLGMT